MNQECFYSIDFESQLKEGDVGELISLEVEKFTIRLLRIIGRDYLPEISQMLVSAYSDQEQMLEAIVGRHYKHPLRRFIKDSFKRKQVGVSRAELAACLSESLIMHRSC